MADRVLFISWSHPVRGAEARATDSIDKAQRLWEQMKSDGRIDSYEFVLLEPNNLVGGFVLVRGSAEQINDVRGDEEFARSTIRGLHTCEEVSHVGGFINGGAATMLNMMREEVASMAAE